MQAEAAVMGVKPSQSIIKCICSSAAGICLFRFIFRVEELNLGQLAMSFALLRLPKMPEITKAGHIEDFCPSAIDPASIKVYIAM